MNSKENPDSLSKLVEILNLHPIPAIPQFRKVKKKMTYNEYVIKYKSVQKQALSERYKILDKYCAGSYKEWEGMGYFNTPVYLYNGIYYG